MLAGLHLASALLCTVSASAALRLIILLIDTGSSNTRVGAGKAFVQTRTTKPMGDLVISVNDSFTGEEFTDQVTLAPGLVMQNRAIGAAIESQGFDGVYGIIGIGPVDLTCETLFPARMILASRFAPTQSLEATYGELTFGGIDESKFTSPLTFVPITSTSPANEFVGIDQTVTYGSQGTVVLASTDTRTTLLLPASDAFATYQNLTGGVLDDATGLLKITSAQFANLQSLFFHIGETTFDFTPNAQLWPRALNTSIGGQSDAIYLIVNDLGSFSGGGLDLIDGMTFLKRFYYVFDIFNSRVGFAKTPFTNAITN
ncbi:hypothetical protein BN946_scf184787.g13 [Trametes cinnabarina]|uniref:Peptidase A1 domain-containing protein n=1 Tax=Pycnoporus cinnabarinus TaxID=5643 RepID=A0A060SYQ5_PYCCI|nr:hypothetical protein BN946_scf184787.g13 [Trametes cinnabarina]